MLKLKEIFYDLVIKTLEETYRYIVNLWPKLALSVVILLIGWISALLLKKIISKLLKALGFDVLSEKIGLKRFLERGGIEKNPSYVAGLCLYWLIIFSALLMIFNTLELEVASQLITQAILYIPKIIVALILLSLGIFLSRFLGKFVQASARLANIPFPSIIGKIARYAVVGFAIIMVLEYLNVTTKLMVDTFIIIFIVIPAVLSLVFLIGGRDIISSILASRLLTKEYKKGDRIEFGDISGEIEEVDFINTKIKSEKTVIIIPNSELVKKIVKKSGGEQNEPS